MSRWRVGCCHCRTLKKSCRCCCSAVVVVAVLSIRERRTKARCQAAVAVVVAQLTGPRCLRTTGRWVPYDGHLVVVALTLRTINHGRGVCDLQRVKKTKGKWKGRRRERTTTNKRNLCERRRRRWLQHNTNPRLLHCHSVRHAQVMASSAAALGMAARRPRGAGALAPRVRDRITSCKDVSSIFMLGASTSRSGGGAHHFFRFGTARLFFLSPTVFNQLPRRMFFFLPRHRLSSFALRLLSSSSVVPAIQSGAQSVSAAVVGNAEGAPPKQKATTMLCFWLLCIELL